MKRSLSTGSDYTSTFFENPDKLLSKKSSEDAEIDEVDENLIPCDGLGDILYTDDEGRKFYTAFQTCDLVVKHGDCVRVKLESESDDLGDSYSFGQVLAIFEDQDQEIWIEVRWFLLPDNLTNQKKSIIQPLPNELVESDALDDIPAVYLRSSFI
jgi:hypothetical protein